MDFPTIDIPLTLVYALAIAFWGAVIVQWMTRQREIKEIRETEKCTRCGKDVLEIDLHVVNQKANRKVGLLKNIWGGLMLLSLGFVLLWGFAGVSMDLITGSNVTGIQDDNLRGQVGLTSFFLLPGLGCTIYGLVLLKDYIVGKKVKVVNLTCNACNMVFALE